MDCNPQEQMENNNPQAQSTAYQQNHGTTYQQQDQRQYDYNQQPPMIKPDSGLVWAILSTVLCCLPFGIVSIVYATKVDTLWYENRFNEACDAAHKAKMWALASAVCSCVGAIIVWSFVFFFSAGSAMISSALF